MPARARIATILRSSSPAGTIAGIVAAPLAVAPDASWTFEPGAIVLVAALTFLYVRRWREIDGSAGRLTSFLAGMALVLIALCSPIDRLGEQLFLMHMVQHLLLLDLAPILVLLGLTKVLLRPLTRRLVRIERRAGVFGHPIFAIVLYVATMAIWHIPAMYDAALEQPVLHVLEHVTFGIAGGLYWWHLLSPIRSRRRLGGMGPVVYMLATKVFVGLLGILLAFSPEAIYGFYERQPGYWGLSPETDQAVGGLIMALEQSIVMGIALVFLFTRALGESEREDQRAERYADSN
ncbi:MAG TPA: cytochrome c oxidase assembly protein [Solirubrobacteraceae bacterium]|nr:cytochrome c oxidase assembly protein [Solirubrobacteraceae bacterium]